MTRMIEITFTYTGPELTCGPDYKDKFSSITSTLTIKTGGFLNESYVSPRGSFGRTDEERSVIRPRVYFIRLGVPDVVAMCFEKHGFDFMDSCGLDYYMESLGGFSNINMEMR